MYIKQTWTKSAQICKIVQVCLFDKKIALSTKDEIFAKKKNDLIFEVVFLMKFILYKISSIILRIQSTYFSSKSSDRTQIQYFLIMYINQLIYQIENNHILMYLRWARIRRMSYKIADGARSKSDQIWSKLLIL